MSEQKMGTHYVRDICQIFRDIAGETQFDVKEKFVSLADELEPIATKLYFKTQKGTEDMKEMAGEMEDFRGKLAGCQDAEAAKTLCDPLFENLQKIIKHVKTMKVRMT